MNIKELISEGVFKNLFLGLLALLCLSAVTLVSAYYLATTTYRYVAAGGYSTWVEVPAILDHAENPTEDHPYDAIYSVEDKDYRAPNYRRSFLSFDYKAERKRSLMRRRNYIDTERREYRVGSHLYLFVDEKNPKNYQFDLFKDIILQLCVYSVIFALSAFYTRKLVLALFSKDEEEYEYVD